MSVMQEEFEIDREELQSLAGSGVDPWLKATEVLKIIKGKEIKAQFQNDQFEKKTLKVIVYESPDKASSYFKLWTREWTGERIKEPWYMNILETL